MSKGDRVSRNVFERCRNEIARSINRPVLKSINQEKLNSIVKEHALWLDGKEGGVCADLSFCKLAGLNLRSVDLRSAFFVGAEIERSDLDNIKLKGSDLTKASISLSTMFRADLREAHLDGAQLHTVDLRWGDLRGATIEGLWLLGVKVSATFFPDSSFGCPYEDSTVEISKRVRLKEYIENPDYTPADFPEEGDG